MGDNRTYLKGQDSYNFFYSLRGFQHSLTYEDFFEGKFDLWKLTLFGQDKLKGLTRAIFFNGSEKFFLQYSPFFMRNAEIRARPRKKIRLGVTGKNLSLPQRFYIMRKE